MANSTAIAPRWPSARRRDRRVAGAGEPGRRAVLGEAGLGDHALLGGDLGRLPDACRSFLDEAVAADALPAALRKSADGRRAAAAAIAELVESIAPASADDSGRSDARKR